LQAAQEDIPEKFFKLPRIRFLLLLCKEILRINRYVVVPLMLRPPAVDHLQEP
jgi:hypothetical protein